MQRQFLKLSIQHFLYNILK